MAALKQQEQQQEALNWGYSRDSLGPNQWADYFETGAHQSPINILVGECAAAATCCHGRLVGEKLAAAHAKASRRTHLDSAGEERHKRSPSSSSSSSGGGAQNSSSGSSSSSSSSSPNYDDDEEESSLEQQNWPQEQHKPAHKSCLQRARQNTRFCVSHKKIFLGYPRYLNTMQLCNTGHSWQVNLPAELASHTLLSGPSLGDREYRLAQFHCHWGEDCDHGSEHQINGKSYSAEIHFVHWNCTDFKSMEEASKHKHGLAVLGVLVQALDGEQNQNKHLEKIIAGLKRIHKPHSSVSIQARLDLKKLFPTNRWSYASYEGSLTTPPLSEVVDWIVFLNPIQCSTKQIEHFRQIRCPSSVNGSGSHLLNNCRPIQPSHGRLVSIWSHH